MDTRQEWHELHARIESLRKRSHEVIQAMQALWHKSERLFVETQTLNREVGQQMPQAERPQHSPKTSLATRGDDDRLRY